MRAFIAAALILLSASAATAQGRGGSSSFVGGFKLEGNLHFNRSAIDNPGDVRQDEHAYGVGIEFVRSSLGVGLYGYSIGRAGSFNADTTQVVVVAEANYYIPIPGLRVAPYAGVHTGLGTFDRSYFDDLYLPGFEDGLDELGYQVGVRFKPFPLIGVDAQWRHQSESAATAQGGFLERNQVLVGVVLF